MAGNTEAPETYHLRVWDHAVYTAEIVRKAVTKYNKSEEVKSHIKEGTYNNTSKGLTAAYTAVIKTYNNAFAAEFEAPIPEERTLKQKKAIYTYSNAGDFPPHLLQKVPQEHIFDDADVKIVKRLVYGNYNAFARGLSRAQYLLPCTLPQTIKDYKIPKSFAELEKNNVELRIEKKSVWANVNVADRPKNDWFTDSVFAQQQFTGTNPTTITLASPEWVAEFAKVAHGQGNDAMEKLLSSSKDIAFYVQDCSYFRKAFGVKDEDPVYVKGGLNSYGDRYTGCPVSLFQLDTQGSLHPLAIVLDYKGSIENSITVFNKRLSPTDPGDQANNWPWRYAKNAAQVGDWIRHEIQIHLTETHFMEESLIVATHRNFETSHLIYRLLSPHWVKTLSLNSAGREALIPHIITPITGVDVGAVKGLINYAYNNFDFQGKYIPNDLEKRGFPLDKLGDPRCRCDKNCTTIFGQECKAGCESTCHQKCDPKFHNYAYARNMKLMWSVLRNFVRGYLASGGEESGFVNDEKVANDESIKAWYTELRSATGGNLQTFPVIKTLDQLVDAVTMCIHIAAPLHTAVNYLQEYYQSFVANKPPALCTPLPHSLEELNKYTEQDMLNSLPVARPLEWLIASHVPTMLSMKPAEDFNLVHHANSVYQAAEDDPVIRKAAKEFSQELWLLGDTYDPKSDETEPENESKKLVKKGVFTLHSEQLDDQESPYMVMDPVDTAVSILI